MCPRQATSKGESISASRIQLREKSPPPHALLLMSMLHTNPLPSAASVSIMAEAVEPALPFCRSQSHRAEPS